MLNGLFDIINLSIGGSFSQDIENSVVNARKKGVLVFAAMGNEGTQGASHPGTSNSSFGVTAVDYDLKVANFSSALKLFKLFHEVKVVFNCELPSFESKYITQGLRVVFWWAWSGMADAKSGFPSGMYFL